MVFGLTPPSTASQTPAPLVDGFLMVSFVVLMFVDPGEGYGMTHNAIFVVCVATFWFYVFWDVTDFEVCPVVGTNSCVVACEL